MADNIDVTPGSGKTIAADDIAGVLHQRVKLALGADGAAADAVGGAGAVGTGVQRVTLASDDPAVTALSTLAGYVDGLEALLTTLNGYVDGLEGYVDGLEGLTTAMSAKLPAALGQAAKSASLAVTMASDQGEIGKTYTGVFNVAATALTRPANTTAYAANDSVSDNATAGSVTANSVTLSDTNDAPIDISEILLSSTDTGPGTAGVQIRLHLFNSNPTSSSGVGAGDNAAWSNKQAGWIGSFSGTMRPFSDGSCGVLVADEGTLRLTSPVSGARTLYWQLQTLGAFTPSANSTTFTPRFKGFQARAA